MMTVMGVVIMPQEKLHALFGLILMTQYFTTVTTSGSLLSSSSSSPSSKSSLSSSLSDSSTSSSKSLVLSPPSHSSSGEPAFSWGSSSEHYYHPGKPEERTHVVVVPHQQQHSSHYHILPHSKSISGVSLMFEQEVPIKISHNSKHQKRHAGGGGGETSSSSQSGNHGNNRSEEGAAGVADGDSVVTSIQETHLLSTSTPSIVFNSSTATSNGSSSVSRSTNPRTDNDDRNDRNRDLRGKCRHKTYLPPNIFELDTCAWCYKYMNDHLVTFGNPSKKLRYALTRISDPFTDEKYTILTLVFNGTGIIANVSDPESPIWRTFANEEARKDWTGCCQAAKECCERMVASWKPDEEPELDGTSLLDNITLPAEKYCPPTWDGWQCWNSTKAGIVTESACPQYIYFLTEPPACLIPVEKECSADGMWARRNDREWTNYTACGRSTLQLQQNRAYVLVIAYGISIVALVPAVIIFFSFKQLRVHRIILHQNLFFSLILNALLVIIFKTTVMMSETSSVSNNTESYSIVRQNSIGCRLLLISTKYSRMTNYMWMLCEGFYLHKLIAAAFAEQKSLLVFYLIGWVFPLFPTAFYAGYRILEANDKCWVVPQEEWEWALNGPSLLSLLVNTLFLINIIRVLVTKLRAAHAQEPSQYRKAVRATLVLLPLFGLHFIVTIYRPSSSTGVCQNWTELYFYANDVLDGMQGFLVALIFCYCNGEVFSLLKRAYMRWKEQHFDVGHHRRNSRHRPSRGSVLGRSVVSTHIYSSIPPSPETNVIALPGGSNSASKDPSPSSQSVVGTNLLTVNGTSGAAVTIPSNPVISPNVKKSDSKSSLKNRKNHPTTAINGNAINMYVSTEYGSVKENPGMEISCV